MTPTSPDVSVSLPNDPSEAHLGPAGSVVLFLRSYCRLFLLSSDHEGAVGVGYAVEAVLTDRRRALEFWIKVPNQLGRAVNTGGGNWTTNA